MDRTDVIVVGAGIVGLATARALAARRPGLRVTVLEKEPEVARHQTSHNSGVVHSGIYYRPGTLRARLCVTGVGLMRDFCREHGLPYEEVGKVVVATDQAELPRLETLFERGQANGVPGLELVDAARLKEIEPHAAGLKAIHSPRTAIVDFPAVARRLAALFTTAGGEVRTGVRVEGVRATGGGVTVSTDHGPVEARAVITCAGVQADRVARLAGADVGDVRIVPFRGEYYHLRPEKSHLVRGLIYPVPDPALPFLGVHLTRTVSGEVEAGPNAVFALSRDGYDAFDVRLADVADAVTFPGLWAMAARFWKVGAYELYRSFSKAAFVEALQRLVPEIGMADVHRGGAGVRAQALGRDGQLLDDFVIRESPRALHVINAPSPAATASLAIAEHLVDLAVAKLGV
ncbi:MAG TPA: L-2-hydroxyglutarate oxidase [Trueperaceae bacterium]|nr:L-2-hydroxyglutarate oxidase [Trueperaceae bacterium]